MKIECDICNKNLWTYLYWEWWVEEKASIYIRYIDVPVRDSNSNIIWYTKFPWIWFPDITCFKCMEKQKKIVPIF